MRIEHYPTVINKLTYEDLIMLANKFDVSALALSASAESDASAKSMLDKIEKARGNFYLVVKNECVKAVLAMFKGQGTVASSATLVASLITLDGNLGHLVRGFLRRAGVKMQQDKATGLQVLKSFECKHYSEKSLSDELKSLPFIAPKKETDSAPRKATEWTADKEGVEKLQKIGERMVKEVAKHNSPQLQAYMQFIIDKISLSDFEAWLPTYTNGKN